MCPSRLLSPRFFCNLYLIGKSTVLVPSNALEALRTLSLRAPQTIGFKAQKDLGSISTCLRSSPTRLRPRAPSSEAPTFALHVSHVSASACKFLDNDPSAGRQVACGGECSAYPYPRLLR